MGEPHETKRPPGWRGWLGWVLFALGAAERIIGWGGSLDFLISRSKDPGWIGDVVNVVVLNTSYLSFFMMLAGVAFIVWNERRRTEKLLESRFGGQPASPRHIEIEPRPSFEPPAPPAPPEDRILLGSNITPTFLTAQHENKTSLEGEAITDKYFGKWMRLTAWLDNANLIAPGWLSVSLQYPRTITLMGGHDRESRGGSNAEFKSDIERLKVRRRGDVLTIEGRLKHISVAGIEMVDCVLLKAETVAEVKGSNQKPQAPQ